MLIHISMGRIWCVDKRLTRRDTKRDCVPVAFVMSPFEAFDAPTLK